MNYKVISHRNQFSYLLLSVIFKLMVAVASFAAVTGCSFAPVTGYESTTTEDKPSYSAIYPFGNAKFQKLSANSLQLSCAGDTASDASGAVFDFRTRYLPENTNLPANIPINFSNPLSHGYVGLLSETAIKTKNPNSGDVIMMARDMTLSGTMNINSTPTLTGPAGSFNWAVETDTGIQSYNVDNSRQVTFTSKPGTAYLGAGTPDYTKMAVNSSTPVSFTLGGGIVPANTRISIRDANGNFISYNTPVSGVNNLHISDFYDLIQVANGATFTQVDNQTAQVNTANQDAAVTIETIGNYDPTSTTKFKFSISVANSSPNYLINVLQQHTFQVSDGAGHTMYLWATDSLYNHVQGSINSTSLTAVIVIDIAAGDLFGDDVSLFGNLKYTQIKKTTAAGSYTFNFGGYQVALDGSTYDTVRPLFRFDYNNVLAMSLLTLQQVTGGTFSDLNIGSTALYFWASGWSFTGTVKGVSTFTKSTSSQSTTISFPGMNVFYY